MSDNRKYYYLKLKENYLRRANRWLLLESMQDGLLYSNHAAENVPHVTQTWRTAILMLNDHLPHTPQTIATFTRHQVGTVETGLEGVP